MVGPPWDSAKTRFGLATMKPTGVLAARANQLIAFRYGRLNAGNAGLCFLARRICAAAERRRAVLA